MRRMYSKKQLEEMIANGKVALEVANVKQLNDAQCELLKAGDLVEKVDSTGKHTYIVTFKKDKVGLCLTYFDASCIETQSYDYTAGHWVYNSEDKTELGGSGLPEVSGADNGKVLEVLSGAWGKGGKKVNVIEPPSSPILTDEEINIITSGVFVNGSFLGRKNPVFFPATMASGLYEGIVISRDNSNRYSYLGQYGINASTKQIILGGSPLINISNIAQFNGKIIPNYPSNTGTFTLKSVDGVITWVQDA